MRCRLYSDPFAELYHNILMMKLEAIGLNQDVVRWFRSYLADRQQLVDVSGTLSSSAEIKFGVPKGSILVYVRCGQQ